MKSKVERKHGNWMVYILRCADGSFYTGATNNLEKRLTGHNRGTASKYTRARLPVQLLATSAKMNKSEALRLEMKIKKLPRAKKLAAFNDLLYNSVIDIT
jgi:putative endonuclease